MRSSPFLCSLRSQNGSYLRPLLSGPKPFASSTRSYLVLAIESSCDDSTVCLIDRPKNGPPVLIDHLKRSLDNSAAGGIIPLDARDHHQTHMAALTKEILDRNQAGIKNSRVPDLVCATRGPGMLASLASGYNVAKGLAVAWDVPLIGVHHMLGHLLTPRFFQSSSQDIPQYPFISLLVSGGHTMLVLSEAVTKHKIVANTMDIAIGDMLDKCSRELGMSGSMLAKELEQFILAGPVNTSCVDEKIQFPNPLTNKHGQSALSAFSFAGFITHLRTVFEKHYPDVKNPATELSEDVRRELARRLQYAMFNHVVTKSATALEHALESGSLTLDPNSPLDFVCSGGVGSNMTLRNMLSEKLVKKLADNKTKRLKKQAKGDKNLLINAKADEQPINFYFPPPKWCTDNALMIGWAGIELWETHGMHTKLSALPTAKWPIESLVTINGWEYNQPQ